MTENAFFEAAKAQLNRGPDEAPTGFVSVSDVQEAFNLLRSAWLSDASFTDGSYTATYSTSPFTAIPGIHLPSTLTLGDAWRVVKVQTSCYARIRIYTTVAASAADISRLPGTDPAPNSGVLLDVLTDGELLMSPLVDGWSVEGLENPIMVENMSSSPEIVTVTLTYLGA